MDFTTFFDFYSATAEVRYNILQIVGPLYFAIYDGNWGNTKVPAPGHETCPSKHADILSLQMRQKAATSMG